MPVIERAMLAATALTGRTAKAAITARNATRGREFVFMFNWVLLLPKEHGSSSKVTENESCRATVRRAGAWFPRKQRADPMDRPLLRFRRRREAGSPALRLGRGPIPAQFQ